jgi:hypothetical protein
MLIVAELALVCSSKTMLPALVATFSFAFTRRTSVE